MLDIVHQKRITGKGATMDQIDRILGHDRWTTTRYLNLCSELTGEQWDAGLDISFKSLSGTFAHMIGSSEFWVDQMEGKTPSEDDAGPASVESLLARHNAVYDRLEALTRQIVADGKLDDSFDNVWGGKQTYGSTILHVTTHSQTHRTEILHILERVGVKNLPEGDFLEWEWHLRTSG